MSIQVNNTAFVLGLFDTGVGAVRSLGRVGVSVIGLDSDPSMPGFKSKYCIPKLCPNPIHEPDELLKFLLEEAKNLALPGILFPSSDAYVLFLSRYRDELSSFFRFALPSPQILESIVNKRKQYEMAEMVGTPYAKTIYPETQLDITEMKDEIDYPAFIKPYYGHLWREKYGGTHKGFKVRTPDELVDRFAEILPSGMQVLVQSIILGPNTNHFKVSACIGQGGDLLAAFTLRKIRQYPTDFGVGTMVESIRNSELLRHGLDFLKGIEYRGIGSIEFKLDERDGILKLIELNSRLWQQNIHATDCGMNFPLIQYLDLTGQNPEPQIEFKVGIRWLDVIADFQSFLSYNRRGELSLLKWYRSIITARSFATFAWDDLGPFFKSNECGLKYLRAPLYILKNRHSK